MATNTSDGHRARLVGLSSRLAHRMEEARPRRTTEDDVLQSAIGLFEEQGFDGTSVQEIVARAGVTKGAFYHHFSSKQQILSRIQERLVDRYVEAIDAMEALGETPKERLRHLIIDMVVLSAEHKAEIAIFFSERRFLEMDGFESVRSKREQFERRVTHVLEQAIADGAVKPITHPRLVAFGMIGMCAWMYQWFRNDGVPKEAIATMYADVLLGGLLSE